LDGFTEGAGGALLAGFTACGFGGLAGAACFTGRPAAGFAASAGIGTLASVAATTAASIERVMGISFRHTSRCTRLPQAPFHRGHSR
jgi:hypothetical protein